MVIVSVDRKIEEVLGYLVEALPKYAKKIHHFDREDVGIRKIFEKRFFPQIYWAAKENGVRWYGFDSWVCGLAFSDDERKEKFKAGLEEICPDEKIYIKKGKEKMGLRLSETLAAWYSHDEGDYLRIKIVAPKFSNSSGRRYELVKEIGNLVKMMKD
jgi:hypothetical protein